MSALKAFTLASLLLVCLAAKPIDAGPALTKSNAGVSDAGAADAGLTLVQRRFKLLMMVNEFKDTLTGTGVVVKIDEILFAGGSTTSKDAAMVLGSVDSKRIGNFFIFDDGKWTVFPTDFSPESVP